MSQLKKGAILSYATVFLTNAVGMLLTPFIIRFLGDADYGLYTLIGALAGYMGVLDLGLNNTIVRFIAKYRSENDKKGEENFLAITMLIYMVISAGIVVIGSVVFFNLEHVFAKSLTLEEIAKAKIMFSILIFNLAITLPGGVFTAICSGYEHFVYPRTVNIIRYLVRSGLVVGLLLWGGDAIGLVVLDTVLNLLIIGVIGFYAFRKLKVTFKLHSFKIILIKEIFLYSLWIFIFAIVQQFYWKGGQVIIGTTLSTTDVAIYAIGILLGSYYAAFSGAISNVFLPRATRMVVNNTSGEELTSMMIKIGRISLAVLLAVLGGFILYGKQFILLWIGETYYEVWNVALILMIVYTVPLIQNFANSLLEAKKLFSFKAIIYLILVIFGTLIGTFLIPFMGVLGMTIGICLGWLISLIIINIYYIKRVELNITRFFKEVSDKLLLGFIFSLTLGYFVNHIPGQGWINLLIKISIYIFGYSVIQFLLGFNKEEKQMFYLINPLRYKNATS